MYRPRTIRVRLALTVLFASLALGLAAPAHAGELDVALLGRGSDNVLYSLHKHNADNKDKKENLYRNVGVLPFEVVKGPKDKGYENAPLALSIVPRLENALILGQDPEGDVIGVIRDATSTASGKALRSYQADKCSKEDFEALFSTTFTRAWGNKNGRPQKVTADAFLTGTVVNPHPKDAGKVQLIIKVIDRDSYKEGRVMAKEIFEIAVPRDRAMLADLGMAYSVPSKKLNQFLSRDTSSHQRDTLLDAEPVDERTAGDFGGMSIKLFYKAKGDKSKGRGSEQALKFVKDEGGAPVFEAPTPEVGSAVSMLLTRKDASERKLGVVLKVNGLSVWQKQDQENVLCQKWLFGPKDMQEEPFDGFYSDLDGKESSVERFKVIPVDQTQGRHLGKRIGWIEAEVFAEAEAPKVKVKPSEKEKVQQAAYEEAQKTKVISTRSVAASVKDLTGKDLAAVQAALRKANNVTLQPIRFPTDKAASRNVIGSTGKAEPGAGIRKDDPIPNPESIGRILIRYYNPEGK